MHACRYNVDGRQSWSVSSTSASCLLFIRGSVADVSTLCIGQPVRYDSIRHSPGLGYAGDVAGINSDVHHDILRNFSGSH